MRCNVSLFALLLLVVFEGVLSAGTGEPVAIRHQPGGTIVIETQWGLRLGIDTHGLDSAQARPAASGPGASAEFDATVSIGDRVDHVLSRRPNKSVPRWRPVAELDGTDPHQLSVRSVGDASESLLWVETDGVRVLVASTHALASIKQADTELDVLVLSPDRSSMLSDQTVIESVRKQSPRLVIVISETRPKHNVVERFKDGIGSSDDAAYLSHGTVAVSASDEDDSSAPRIVIPAPAPWVMPEPLATLFAAVDQSCKESQEVFAKLSAAQMNFKPSNGTHTPRWNTEHMMGRQLLFFSQIYHELDANVPVMDLNPKQMPKDYRAAHPDWDGAEEARQMQRANQFCRRFAYLLAGMNVDEKAPGSSWPSLRALLKQMERHYREHTANTIKKFELPDWPAE